MTNSTESQAIFLVSRLIALATVLQGIELILLRDTFQDRGIWTWKIIQKEFEVFPRIFRKIFNTFLNDSHFIFLVFFQIGVGILFFILPSGPLALGLFMSATLCCLRWRGTFNGGSDFMTLVVLTGVSVGLLGHHWPLIQKGCLWYIGIQASTSYFNAGLVKLKSKNWRTGLALQHFLAEAIYPVGNPLDRLLRLPRATFCSSWLVILFECSFPLAWINPHICRVYLVASFIFHLANIYLFGLNRFLFAWIATYPALYFCSTNH